MADGNRNPQVTAEAAAQLQEGINLVLSRWAALQMAVENEWGGRDSRQKSHQLGQTLFCTLTQSKEQVYIDDLEDVLDDFMLSLNTEIGDGSIEEIAEKLMVMHEECSEGNFNSIEQLKAINPPAPYIRQAGNKDGDDSDDDDSNSGDDSSEMDVDAPACQPSSNPNDAIIDEPNVNGVPKVEDGWTVVSSRRNRGRNN